MFLRQALQRSLADREAQLGALRRELAAARRAGGARAARAAGLASALRQLLAAPDAGRCNAHVNTMANHWGGRGRTQEPFGF